MLLSNFCIILFSRLEPKTIFSPIYLKGTTTTHLYNNSSSLSIFKNLLLRFLHPSPKSSFGPPNPQGIKFLTLIRVSLINLCEHKFKHQHQYSLPPALSILFHSEKDKIEIISYDILLSKFIIYHTSERTTFRHLK